MIKSVTLIGAGNLATRLGLALNEAGVNIEQVYSRTEDAARELALLLDAGYTNHLEEVRNTSDLIIVAIKDDAITELLDQIAVGNKLIVHTSGSVAMQSLAAYSANYGVFYPLQTFSKSRAVNFEEIPFCLEANTNANLASLKELASKVSQNVYEIDSEERRVLHLSAVFVCNFVNHFYHLGDQLLSDQQLDFNILKPLIKETAAKITELKPAEAQTGPAVRFDETIINKHLKILEEKPELRKIYSFVSESIHQTHKKN